jgi:oligopeptide transport system substrate-binding protein
MGDDSLRRYAGVLVGLVLSVLSAAAHAESVLRVGNGQEPETLDPHRSKSVSAASILRDLYEGLTSVAPDGRVIAGAAQSWEISADGLSYTFFLRPQARWSNGDPVTAQDFVAGLRRSVDPATGSSYAGMLSPIRNAPAVIDGRLPPQALGVAAIDPLTLRIELSGPTPYLLGMLTHSSTFPIHGPSLQRWGKQFARAGRLVSNGAYRLQEWVVQSHVSLVRNAQYWNDAQTRIERVRYYPTEDLNSELKRYRAGELDVTFQIPLVQAPWIQRELGSELRVATYLGVYYYGFNVTKPPFKDNAKLRQALALAIDRELITRKVMNGMAQPAYAWVPPGTAEHRSQRPDWADWPRERQLAEARRLYAEAGYSAERPLKTEIRYNTHEDHKRIAVVIAAMWKQHLGVQATLVNEEAKVFFNNRELRKVTEAFRGGWIGDFDDASTFMELLQSQRVHNNSGWVDAEYDALLAQAAAETDIGARRQLLEAAERRLLEEMPVMPIYYYVSKHLVKPQVRGWQDNLLDYHYSKDLSVVR